MQLEVENSIDVMVTDVECALDTFIYNLPF